MLRRLQELVLHYKYKATSCLDLFPITRRLKHDFPKADIDALQIEYELLVMKSGMLLARHAERSLIEAIRSA